MFTSVFLSKGTPRRHIVAEARDNESGMETRFNVRKFAIVDCQAHRVVCVNCRRYFWEIQPTNVEMGLTGLHFCEGNSERNYQRDTYSDIRRVALFVIIVFSSWPVQNGFYDNGNDLSTKPPLSLLPCTVFRHDTF